MMTAAALWISRPVFVCSTFRDMHAERDHLRQIVFPELEVELRNRRHHLEPIDLRWGVETVSVDDEEAKELLVLKVCLTEIERSRPFLVVLLGDRYGWIPPEDRMTAAARESGFSGDVSGKSVTALEIEFGALSDSGQLSRTWFYFRDSLTHEQLPKERVEEFREVDPDAARRLKVLKERIVYEHPDRVRYYSLEWDFECGRFRQQDLENFGQRVRDDLWSDLDDETKGYIKQPAPTWQEEERWELEMFVADRGRGFMGREATVRELCELALSMSPKSSYVGASVTGQAGSGKSSLFAHLYRVFKNEDVLLLGHAAGISLRSQQVDSLLRRWIGELAVFLKSDDPSAEITDAEQLESIFASLLGRASLQKRVVVLLDALNQFEPTVRARHLTWWPQLCPENVRIIATSIPGTASAALERRSWVLAIALPLLTQVEAEQIVRAVCRRYHREIHPDVVRNLLAKESAVGTPAAGIPLWLELAVEELNLLDADDFQRGEYAYEGTPEARLHRLLLDTAESLPATVAELYSAMLERTEEIVGRPLAKGFANLIALSRSGWRETDFEVLLPRIAGENWSSLKFAILRRAFRAHLVRRGVAGQYDFFHQQMRQAIRRRNLPDVSLVRELHAHIADYLASIPAEEQLRQTELMFHLIGTDDRLRAARCYGDELDRRELAGATRALADHILADVNNQTEANLDWVLSLLDLEGVSALQKSRLCINFLFHLADSLENETVLTIKYKLFELSLNTLTRLVSQDPNNPGKQLALSVSHERVGDMLQALGDTRRALEAYQTYQAIASRMAALDLTKVIWQRDLMSSYNKIGDVLLAQGDAGAALGAYREYQAIATRLSAQDPTEAEWQRTLSVSYARVGEVLLNQGDTAGALESYRQYQAMAAHLVDREPKNCAWQLDLAVSHAMVGDILLKQGDMAGALQSYRESLSIIERLATQDPTNARWQLDLGISHANVGDVLLKQGDTAGALQSYRESLSITERLVARDSTNTVWQRSLSVSHTMMGDILLEQGDAAGALESYRESLGITERLVVRDSANTVWQRDLAASLGNVGNILLKQGDTAGALQSYRESLSIIERLVARDPANSVWQWDVLTSYRNVSEVLLAQGDVRGALHVCQKSQTIREHLLAKDPTNTDRQRELARLYSKMGDLFLASVDARSALQSYRESLSIQERLVAQDPTNTDWQRDRAISHHMVGDVLLQLGDAECAVQSYRKSLGFAEWLVARDPTNADWQRSLMNLRMQLLTAYFSRRTVGFVFIVATLAAGWGLIALGPWNGWWWIVSGIVTVMILLFALRVAILRVGCIVRRRRYRQ